jgi:pyoverdine/dityrosine biosynthesis protein Dit1
MSASKMFDNIEFSRLRDLVDFDSEKELDEILYVSNATNFRRALLHNFGRNGWDPAAEIEKGQDVCMTYRGYIKFLETDLRHVYPIGNDRSKSKFKSGMEYIAKQMLIRGEVSRQIASELGGTLCTNLPFF